MKKIALLSALSLAASAQVMAAGYKIPEQSANSTALSAAYVANVSGADASYNNPAAMAFNEDKSQFEVNLTYIQLTPISFESSGVEVDKTKSENFFVPTFHYVSPAVDKIRFGLSVVAPGGLSKRWKGVLASSAEEFSLKIAEVNPTISYQINDRLAVGGGLRLVKTEGVVKSSATANPAVPIGRDMKGDSIDYGYNLALLYKPTNELSLAATYRSLVDLTVEGDADLTNTLAFPTYSGDAEVTIPLPAALNLAAAYTIQQKTTVEFVYERTYWSDYKELDFDYEQNFVGHPLYNAFDEATEKKWQDSNTYRLGVTHELNNNWNLMAAIAFDETPIKKKYVGYELPDSDAMLYSVGARLQQSDQLSFAAAVLYDQKEDLNIKANDNNVNGIVGKFKGASAYLFTLSLHYTF